MSGTISPDESCCHIGNIAFERKAGDVIYTSRVKVGPSTLGYRHEVYLDGFDTPIIVGAHGAVKKRMFTVFKPTIPIPEEETIHCQEYVTTALAASSMEALGDALEARGIFLEPDGFTAEVEGDFEKEIGPARPVIPGRVSLLSRIRIRYHLKVPRGKCRIVEDVLESHLQGNNIFQSIKEGIKGYFDWEIKEAG